MRGGALNRRFTVTRVANLGPVSWASPHGHSGNEAKMAADSCFQRAGLSPVAVLVLKSFCQKTPSLLSVFTFTLASRVTANIVFLVNRVLIQ